MKQDTLTAQETKELTPLEKGLQEIAPKLTNSDINKIAAKLDIVPPTVKDYLQLKIAKESRGKSILRMGKSLLQKRNAA